MSDRNCWDPRARGDGMLVRSCARYVRDAFRMEAGHRSLHEDWIERERLAVAVAANEWGAAHGFRRRVTVGDVERFEGPAVGHVDYADKLALYAAEFVVSGQHGFGEWLEGQPSTNSGDWP